MVDSDLKVYGTSNIRVADNSVMPLLVSAHTQVCCLLYCFSDDARSDGFVDYSLCYRRASC